MVNHSGRLAAVPTSIIGMYRCFAFNVECAREGHANRSLCINTCSPPSVLWSVSFPCAAARIKQGLVQKRLPCTFLKIEGKKKCDYAHMVLKREKQSFEVNVLVK